MELQKGKQELYMFRTNLLYMVGLGAARATEFDTVTLPSKHNQNRRTSLGANICHNVHGGIYLSVAIGQAA